MTNMRKRGSRRHDLRVVRVAAFPSGAARHPLWREYELISQATGSPP
jgi:hypothetical protein